MTTRSAPRRNVHPFPARMAPEVALEKIESLTDPGAVVLDPMCGSGTVPRIAGDAGRHAIATDIDPLAVLMTRTSCTPAWSKELETRAEDLVKSAMRLKYWEPPWIGSDTESTEFVDFWFAGKQKEALGRIARVLHERPRTDDPLRVALSRLIVTKDKGASLARDTSHSRPHRVRTKNDFDVYLEFVASAARVEKLVGNTTTHSRPSIRSVDARNLRFVERGSVDLVVTSPPYLNAIDYLRGHRLSLVWLGWTVGELRDLRRESIGTERALVEPPESVTAMAINAAPRMGELAQREQRMIWRFAHDMNRLCRSLARVTRPAGHLVFVVADSLVKGIPVPNSTLCRISAEKHGFDFLEEIVRPLPAQHRYLPPPETSRGSFGSRMREEIVLTFQRTTTSSPPA